jgi:hypothetical protein
MKTAMQVIVRNGEAGIIEFLSPMHVGFSRTGGAEPADKRSEQCHRAEREKLAGWYHIWPDVSIKLLIY